MRVSTCRISFKGVYFFSRGRDSWLLIRDGRQNKRSQLSYEIAQFFVNEYGISDSKIEFLCTYSK